MKKVLSVVGARPQFIKAAALSREIRTCFEETLVHTGQHYDANMSQLFFDELEIPLPDYNLGIGSGSHGRQTAEMLIGLEKVIEAEKPDCVLVYGDTNSTLAAALAASKLLVPLAHVEAGLRSFNRVMPEEQNRIVTDHLSSLLFCPTPVAVENLRHENITEGVFNVGDVMCDAVLEFSRRASHKYSDASLYLNDLFDSSKKIKVPKEFYLSTIHRAENTGDGRALKGILAALSKCPHPVVFPVHPRIASFIKEICPRGELMDNIMFVEPVGYLEMLFLTKSAKKVVTDSGGLQKESYIVGTPCVTVREQTEWIETLIDGWNVLVSPSENELYATISASFDCGKDRQNPYGSGDASKSIAKILSDAL